MRRSSTLLCAGLICLTAAPALAGCAGSDRPDAAQRLNKSPAAAPGAAEPPAARKLRPAASTTRPHRKLQTHLIGPHVAPPPAPATPTVTQAPPAAPPPPPAETHSAPVRKPAAVVPSAPRKPAAPVRAKRTVPARSVPARPRIVSRPAVPAPAAVPIVALPAVAPPLLLGFQDDASFRWSPARQRLLDQASAAGATLIRTMVNWSQVAPKRPARPRDSFDPAYHFDNLDELIRNAQQRGIQVLLTIWGTPAWANGAAGHNHAPAKAADLRDFAQAVADRYSGRHAGYPFVGHYTVWNEPNLEQFLAPQYDSAGQAVAPAAYARLYRAAYAGIKAGNPSALVAIGETSPRGRDLPTQSRIQQSESPGRFAQLLSRQRPRVQFDAWAHHPYPTAPNLPPTQLARWPNVTLAELPRFEAALRSWFGRADVPIWITEYAYQTNPPYDLGVSPARQAAYLKQSLAMVAREPWVRMVLWFTFRDSPGNPWKSGLTAVNGAPKPSLAAFAAAGRALAARNATVAGSSSSRVQEIPLPAQPISYYSGTGAAVGLTYRVLLGGVTVADGQAAADLRRDGTVILRLPFRPRAGKRYTVRVTYSDVHGNRLSETRTLLATG